jgi:hypothetical protein
MDLQIQNLLSPSTLLLVCSQCEISNRVALPESGDDPTRSDLARCVQSHPATLRLSAVEVETDAIGLFCNTCRISRKLSGLSFESTLED